MRIGVSILLFLVGCVAIAYSYIASFLTLAGDVEKSARSGDEGTAFAMIVDFILRGEIPQVTGFLYVGLLLIAIAFVNLIRSRSKNDQ